MHEVVLNYPHFVVSREPRPMRRDEIWAVAEQARGQIVPHPRRPKVEFPALIARSRRLRVNDLAFETIWQLGDAVTDRSGQPVLGLTEYQDHAPQTALIHINTVLI